MKIVAIDMGKSKSVVCEYAAAHDTSFSTIPTSIQEFRGVLERTRPERVVIEVGPSAGWVHDLCGEMKIPLEVANTAQELYTCRRTKRKTDKDDALRLAQLSVMQMLQTVHIPAAPVREWRGLIRYRHAQIQRRTTIKNTIRALLHTRAIPWASGAAAWTQAGLKELAELARQHQDTVMGMQLEEELKQYRAVQETIDRLETKLDAISALDARVALLRTIPGVGPRLAEVIVAIIDDPRRFSNGKQVGCYAGLTPRQHQSGDTNRQGRISGEGDTLLRSLLVEVSWLGRRHNPWMKAVYENALRGSPKRKKIAIVALARRLLVACWAMLRDNTPWRTLVQEGKAAA